MGGAKTFYPPGASGWDSSSEDRSFQYMGQRPESSHLHVSVDSGQCSLDYMLAVQITSRPEGRKARDERLPP